MANTTLTATNTWKDGLVMDLAPDNTQNTCLTSALNATIITYNGNEYSLQNDMGNGRVETAYLPEGYIPVGTCELGGIIYIASYNPLTNKSQLGSFPSPERNISSEELGLTNITFSNSDFYYIKDEKSYLIPVVKKKLTQKKLNPGDKFLVCGNIQANQDYLYNYNTITGGKIVDIENNSIYDEYGAIIRDGTAIKIEPDVDGPINLYLASSDASNKIHELTELSDKGNGYYIAEEPVKQGDELDIDSYRRVLNQKYDVFQEKSSGDLYAIAEVLTINTFGVNFDYVYKGTGWEITPKFKQTSKYKGISANSFCVQYVENNQNKEVTIDANGYNGTTKFEFETNTYKITPEMYGCLLDWLSVTVDIDTSLLGTGEVDITQWRYFHNTDNLSLRIGLQVYPEPDKNINTIQFKFYEYSDTKAETESFALKYTSTEAIHTHETIQYGFNYTTSNYNGIIELNKLYLVSINILYKEETKETVVGYRWLYTCPVFNQEYLESKELDFINLKPKLEPYIEISESVINSNYSNKYVIPDLLQFDNETFPEEVDEQWVINNTTATDTKTTNYEIQLQAEVKLKNDYGFFKVDQNKCMFNWSHEDSNLIIPELNIQHEGSYWDFPKIFSDTSAQKMKEFTITPQNENKSEAILKLTTTDLLRIYGTTEEKDMDLDILRPLIYDIDSSSKYDIEINGSNILKINSQTPAMAISNGNTMFKSIIRFEEEIEENKWDELDDVEADFSYSNLFNDTNYQNTIQDLILQSGDTHYTIFPILYAFVKRGEDVVNYIKTKYILDNQKNNLAYSKDYWKQVGSSVNQGDNGYFYIIEDINNIDSNHENFPDVWFYCIKDTNDKIIPLNCFTYKAKDADSYQSIYDKDNLRSWVMYPIANLLTQLYKWCERTTVKRQLVSYLSFPFNYSNHWITPITNTAILEESWLNVPNAELANSLKIDLSNITPEYSNITVDSTVTTKYTQSVKNSLSNSILLNKYKEKIVTILYTKLETFKDSTSIPEFIMQQGGSKENQLYYLFNQKNDDSDNYIIKELDGNFVLNNYTNVREVDKKIVATDGIQGIDTLGKYLTLDDSGLLRLNSNVQNSNIDLPIYFGEGDHINGSIRATVNLNRNLKLGDLYAV